MATSRPRGTSLGTAPQTPDFFAPLSDQEQALVVGGWVNSLVGILASSNPWLALAAPVLQIVVTRGMQMWRGDHRRPTQAFNSAGVGAAVWYRTSSGVAVNAVPLLGNTARTTEVITGTFAGTGAVRRRLRSGDPVAVVLNGTSWGSRSRGLVVPARFGEPFRIEVPRGEYGLSAYALAAGSPRVDPVHAIGAMALPARSGLVHSSIVLQPRARQLTRSALTELNRDLPERDWSFLTNLTPWECRHCGRPNLLSTTRCFTCLMPRQPGLRPSSPATTSGHTPGWRPDSKTSSSEPRKPVRASPSRVVKRPSSGSRQTSPSSTLLVGFDLGDQSSGVVVQRLKSFGTSWRFLDSVWFVKTAVTPAGLRDELRNLNAAINRLLVIDVGRRDWAGFVKQRPGGWLDRNIGSVRPNRGGSALLVGFQPGARNDQALVQKLKSSGTWWHPLDAMWLVRTSLGPQEFRNFLRSPKSFGDHLLIIDVSNGNWAAVGFKERSYDWLRRNLVTRQPAGAR